MRRLVPRSFFGQLFLGTVLVQTLFLGLFIWYTVVTQKRGAEDRLRQRTVQQLDQLSEACSVDLSHGDMESLHRVLGLSRIAPSIQTARLTDLNGRTLAVSDIGRDHGLDNYELAVLSTAMRRQIFTIKNGQMEAVTPVLENGKAVALLWLEPNHAASLNTLETVVRIAVTYGGFALLANILPIFLIVRTITKPLRRLRAATYEVMRNPNLNAGFPLPVTTTNEAGELTASFNSMVKELEEQRSGLFETLALLDSMLRNAPIGFAFFDHELRYVRVNEFLAGLHELPVEQHLGRRPTDVYPPEIGVAKVEYLRRVFEDGLELQNVEFSGEMPHTPGIRRSWMMHFYPVRTGLEEVRWVGVIVIETTEQLRAEEALRKTEKLAAAGRLASSIAHEINNPLEAVTNLLYLLRTDDSLNETSSQLIGTAEAELARVSEITQQMLRFHRQASLPAATNLASVFDSILSLYKPKIASANISVAKRFCDGPEVFGFGGELRQLFANLIGNAIDAMSAGGTLTLRIWRGHGHGIGQMWASGVRVSVTDTGVGMAEETRRRIFEAFFTTKEATGTGLGLWVSDEIVRKHSATIRVRSRQGARSGTSFLLFFPDAGNTTLSEQENASPTTTPLFPMFMNQPSS
jgi:signal transduction histidine kinase